MAHKHKGCISMQLQSVIIRPWRCEDLPGISRAVLIGIK